MNNRKRYQSMMEQVHAPERLLDNLRSIPMEKTKRQRSLIARYATATLVGVLAVFAMTNGVSYAATGHTWVEHVTVMINGEPREVDVEVIEDGDVMMGRFVYDLDDESQAEISYEIDPDNPIEWSVYSEEDIDEEDTASADIVALDANGIEAETQASDETEAVSVPDGE